MCACKKICYIVRLRQMLRSWRRKAATASRRACCAAPSDVPAGHVAITVGSRRSRFVVRTAYLNHPVFRNLLVQAEEEYGFANTGPIAVPCDEQVFEEILQYLSRSESMSLEEFQRNCFRSNLDLWAESRPLLYGGSGKSIC